MPDGHQPSRRDLFRGRPFRRSRPGTGHRGDLSLALLQRPPGAIAEGQFLASCTRCGECIEVCPPGAIRTAPDHAGPRRAGTPFIDAIRQACVMCTDLPCVAACDPGVLRSELPVKMADAEIDRTACLPWQGQACTLCADHCPVDGAITVDPDGRPTIEQALCTGCGVCMQVCPAPRNAVDFRPVAIRPFWPLA